MAPRKRRHQSPPSPLNTFKLFKLPVVILEEVMSHMDFHVLFYLAMASKTTQKLIHFIGKSPFVKLAVDISKDDKTVVVFSENLSDPPIIALSFCDSPNARKRGRQMRSISGIEMDIRHSETSVLTDSLEYDNVPRLICNVPLNRLDVAMDAAISHLLGTFRHSQISSVLVDFKGINEKFCARRALGAVKSVSGLELKGDTFHSKQHIQYLLSNVEVSENLYYNCPVSLGTSLPDKLNCSGVIDCSHSTWMRPETLWNMNCDTIRLGSTRFRSEDIQEFLRKWKNSEGKDKIEYVEIHHPFGVTLDYHALDAKPYDPTVRPAIYPTEYYPDLDCSGGMDIQRADGRIGTIFRATDACLFFLVWLELIVD